MRRLPDGCKGMARPICSKFLVADKVGLVRLLGRYAAEPRMRPALL